MGRLEVVIISRKLCSYVFGPFHKALLVQPGVPFIVEALEVDVGLETLHLQFSQLEIGLQFLNKLVLAGLAPLQKVIP